MVHFRWLAHPWARFTTGYHLSRLRRFHCDASIATLPLRRFHCDASIAALPLPDETSPEKKPSRHERRTIRQGMFIDQTGSDRRKPPGPYAIVIILSRTTFESMQCSSFSRRRLSSRCNGHLPLADDLRVDAMVTLLSRTTFSPQEGVFCRKPATNAATQGLTSDPSHGIAPVVKSSA